MFLRENHANKVDGKVPKHDDLTSGIFKLQPNFTLSTTFTLKHCANILKSWFLDNTSNVGLGIWFKATQRVSGLSRSTVVLLT